MDFRFFWYNVTLTVIAVELVQHLLPPFPAQRRFCSPNDTGSIAKSNDN